MNPSVYIKGLDQLERNVNHLLKDLNSEKTGILLEQAKVVRDAVRTAAPRGPTGNLKAAAYAIAYPETTTRLARAYAGIRPRRAPHAHFLEQGTVRMKPHPFFAPAWESVRERVYQSIKDGLKQTIEGSI
jgi:HK97 gp10 family phage protein